jgi:hypothetical protein
MPVSRPDEAALQILRGGYSLLPIVAGADKFTNFLVDWDKYLAPSVKESLPINGRQFMRAAGVVEIAAGLLVAARPRWGGYVVSAWLAGIVGNLLMTPGYKDIALRDFGLSLGALALAKLSE